MCRAQHDNLPTGGWVAQSWTCASDADYILGHDDVERRRLDTQALFMEPLTRRELLAAGPRPGMRVLDVGAGFGDVTLLAASLVGSTGSVVGIEREDSAVAAATAGPRRWGRPTSASSPATSATPSLMNGSMRLSAGSC